MIRIVVVGRGSGILTERVWNPKLSKADVARAIKGMEGSDFSKGGVVGYEASKRSISIAAERIVNGNFDDTNGVGGVSVMDYNLMNTEELLEECITRGM